MIGKEKTFSGKLILFCSILAFKLFYIFFNILKLFFNSMLTSTYFCLFEFIFSWWNEHLIFYPLNFHFWYSDGETRNGEKREWFFYLFKLNNEIGICLLKLSRLFWPTFIVYSISDYHFPITTKILFYNLNNKQQQQQRWNGNGRGANKLNRRPAPPLINWPISGC